MTPLTPLTPLSSALALIDIPTASRCQSHLYASIFTTNKHSAASNINTSNFHNKSPTICTSYFLGTRVTNPILLGALPPGDDPL